MLVSNVLTGVKISEPKCGDWYEKRPFGCNSQLEMHVMQSWLLRAFVFLPHRHYVVGFLQAVMNLCFDPQNEMNWINTSEKF